jgi:hypothetical protein
MQALSMGLLLLSTLAWHPQHASAFTRLLRPTPTTHTHPPHTTHTHPTHTGRLSPLYVSTDAIPSNIELVEFSGTGCILLATVGKYEQHSRLNRIDHIIDMAGEPESAGQFCQTTLALICVISVISSHLLIHTLTLLLLVGEFDHYLMKAAVLVYEHNERGSLGAILNKPSAFRYYTTIQLYNYNTLPPYFNTHTHTHILTHIHTYTQTHTHK